MKDKMCYKIQDIFWIYDLNTLTIAIVMNFNKVKKRCISKWVNVTTTWSRCQTATGSTGNVHFHRIQYRHSTLRYIGGKWCGWISGRLEASFKKIHVIKTKDKSPNSMITKGVHFHEIHEGNTIKTLMEFMVKIHNLI